MVPLRGKTAIVATAESDLGKVAPQWAFASISVYGRAISTRPRSEAPPSWHISRTRRQLSMPACARWR